MNVVYFFIVVAAAVFTGWSLRMSAEAVLAEDLTYKLRRDSFANILRMNMAFFDYKEHSPRLLTARLANDATLVHGAASERITALFEMCVSFLASFILGFYFGWQLALVVLGIGPLMALAGALAVKAMLGQEKLSKQAFEQAARLAGESIAGMRTILAFNGEHGILARFSQLLQPHLVLAVRRAVFSGISGGFVQLCIFCAFSICFEVALVYSQHNIMSFSDSFHVIFLIITAYVKHCYISFLYSVLCVVHVRFVGTGKLSSLLPDYNSARIAADSIFDVIDTSTVHARFVMLHSLRLLSPRVCVFFCSLFLIQRRRLIHSLKLEALLFLPARPSFRIPNLPIQ